MGIFRFREEFTKERDAAKDIEGRIRVVDGVRNLVDVRVPIVVYYVQSDSAFLPWLVAVI